ncbi:MAG: hypothetical protein DRH20_01820 [Deltaproteobacteria bacterium]|nr:MAG: hypothetical protein DRH20_01820 [Deltaproteobacteria bacterium]
MSPPERDCARSRKRGTHPQDGKSEALGEDKPGTRPKGGESEQSEDKPGILPEGWGLSRAKRAKKSRDYAEAYPDKGGTQGMPSIDA